MKHFHFCKISKFADFTPSKPRNISRKFEYMKRSLIADRRGQVFQSIKGKVVDVFGKSKSNYVGPYRNHPDVEKLRLKLKASITAILALLIFITVMINGETFLGIISTTLMAIFSPVSHS